MRLSSGTTQPMDAGPPQGAQAKRGHVPYATRKGHRGSRKTRKGPCIPLDSKRGLHPLKIQNRARSPLKKLKGPAGPLRKRRGPAGPLSAPPSSGEPSTGQRRPGLPRADPAVLSALGGLASGFGTGPGVPRLLWPLTGGRLPPARGGAHLPGTDGAP